MAIEHMLEPEVEEEKDETTIPDAELQQRVVFSLLLPAMSMAGRFGVPLKELGQWTQVAYFDRLRGAGLTLREASDVLDISVRTAKRLSQQLKVNFLRPELEHNLPVKIEFMLRAEPMSLARLKQVLREVPQDTIEAAVQQLVQEGRIHEDKGRTPTLHVVRGVQSLVRDTWLARIGGLNSLLENLGDTIYGRFFVQDKRSFARTLTFHVKPEQYDELERIFNQMVEEVAELDAEARGQDDAIPVRLSHFFAPFGLMERNEDEG